MGSSSRAWFGLIAVIAASSLSACASSDPAGTPTACSSSPGMYLTALGVAPGEVLLGGETPISECLVDEQSSSELQSVGQALIATATTLNAKSRADLAGPESVRLGYLVGAIERGADTTGGIHADLIRRINSAARFAPGGRLLPAEFERAFGQGYAAGRESG